MPHQPPGTLSLMHQQVRQRLGRERIVLYMGRLATEKNVEALLRAWRLVSPEGCRLVIVGDGPLAQQLDEPVQRRSDPLVGP